MALDGHETWSSTLDVTAGETGRVDVRLRARAAAPPTPEPVDVARVYPNEAGQVDTLARKLKGASPSYPSGRAPRLKSGQRVSVLVRFVVTDAGRRHRRGGGRVGGQAGGRRGGRGGARLEVRAGDEARRARQGRDELPPDLPRGLAAVSKLIVNPTSSNRREILLSRTTILTIGRDPSNDLVLPDAMVSRRHAVVEHRGKQFFLRDCSSANGSVVNGDRVSERPLRDGDLVAIGSMRLLFRDEVVEAVGGKVLAHPSAAPLECPTCKSLYRRGDLFCRECGAQVAQPSGPPKAVCAACGASVPLPARFCNSCGGTLAADGQRVEEPPASGEAARPQRHAAGADRVPGASASRERAVRDGARGPAAAASAHRRCRSPRATPSARPSESAAGAAADAGAAPRARARRARQPAGGLRGRHRLRRLGAGGPARARRRGTGGRARRRARPSDVALLPVIASVTLLPLALLLGVLYHVYFWSVKGATPGKELLDLRVVTDDGVSPIPLASALRRALGYLLSAASLGLGFLMVAFGGRGLHDRIAVHAGREGQARR